jgi:hypothetical protein
MLLVVRPATSSHLTRLLTLTGLAWTLLAFNAGAQTRGDLESFYMTFSNTVVVHVEKADPGVKVRVINIDAHEEACAWQRVVRARDVVMRDVEISSLAATPVCSLSQRRVERALEASRQDFISSRDGIPTGLDINTVVASCRGQEKRFVFDNHMKSGIDEPVLRRFDRQVHALWAMGDRILEKLPASAPDAASPETLGTAAAADLVAGKYDAAYRDQCWDDKGNRARCSPPFWTQLLGDYKGPPEPVRPLPIELVDQASWQFAHYEPPVFPPIALSARVFRDIRLRLDVERATGAVTQADIIDGTLLLNEAALKAARKWRFVPGTTPADPFEVTLRFELRCPVR